MATLAIKSAAATHLRQGYPWVYTQGLTTKKPLFLPPGHLVTLIDESKSPLGTGYYNPLTKLACRVLSLSPKEFIDVAFFIRRFTHALERRERFFNSPFYRFVHSESDYLPGLVIDRFDDTFVCQTNTAGMERLKPIWLEALITLFKPTRVIFKDNAPLREKEGLTLTIEAAVGNVEGEINIIENNFQYYADPLGQKTGWFFDHRNNRHWVSSYVKKQTVLDLYTYHGGFGLLAASRGAAHVTFVDSSEKAIAFTKKTALHHGLTQCDYIHEDVFVLLENAISNSTQFDVVIADPPAFVKQASHKGAGLRGYQKLAFLASQVVAPKGLLFIASCSHHASNGDFRKAVEAGITKSNRRFQLVRKAGADKDHPIHPQLPETQYLKSLAYRLDLPEDN